MAWYTRAAMRQVWEAEIQAGFPAMAGWKILMTEAEAVVI